MRRPSTFDIAFLAAVFVALGGCEDEGGFDWDAFQCDVEPIEMPASLGIVDDDDEWLCGDASPEEPEDYDDWGMVAVGVRACFAGEEGTLEGTDLYVAPGGDDSSSGRSPDEPLATLAFALCHAVPGQTIHLAPGVYDQPGVLLGSFGTETSAELVIRGEGGDPEEVVLEGSRWRSFAVGLTESHNIRLENLTIQNYTTAGVNTLLGSGVTLRHVVSRRNGRCNLDPEADGEGFGVNFVGTEDVVVEDSLFDDNGPLYRVVVCGSALGTAINTYETSGVLRNNEITRTRGGAMLVENGGPFEVRDSVAERNFLLAYQNYWDAAIWVDGSIDVRIEDNRFVDNWGGVGVIVSDEDERYPGASRGTRISGNSISGNVAGIHVWGYGACPPPAEAVADYDRLAELNDLSNNTFRDQDMPLRCDPQFAGGELP